MTIKRQRLNAILRRIAAGAHRKHDPSDELRRERRRADRDTLQEITSHIGRRLLRVGRATVWE